MPGSVKLLPLRPALRSSNLLLCSVLGVLVLFPPRPGLAAKTDDSDLERAVQNPVLWSHFRVVARDSHSHYDSFGRKRYRRHPDLDAHTKILIEGFLKQVSRQSSEFVSLGGRLVELERQTTSASQARELDVVLKDLQKAARNLRGTLARVYFSLNEGRLTRARGEEEADVDELTQLVFSTHRAVYGYVFQGQHTVTIHQLKNENMLFRLYRIQEMARQLHRQRSGPIDFWSRLHNDTSIR